MDYIFVSGNVPSSKNSKQWTGRMLIDSKASREYRKDTEEYWSLFRQSFLDMFYEHEQPWKVGLYFVRKSKHKFDYINACQIIADLMTEYGWIIDDNADFFVPVFLGYRHDKHNSGVYIVSMQKDSFIFEVEPNFTSNLK